MHAPTSRGGGYYPLDIELGLTGDGFSLLLTSCAARLASKVSYAQTVLLLTLFLRWSPAQSSLEELVLGLGRHTAAWFAHAPAPSGDGDVLVIQIDSKATPTATEAELEKRRGPRAANPHPGSQRHRGRAARLRRGGKKRRQKGDKAKNGKMATIVVMYTLRKSADGTLEGPLNKKVYASYAPKRHAVAIARLPGGARHDDCEAGFAIVEDRLLAAIEYPFAAFLPRTSGGSRRTAIRRSNWSRTGIMIWNATLRNCFPRPNIPSISFMWWNISGKPGRACIAKAVLN